MKITSRLIPRGDPIMITIHKPAAARRGLLLTAIATLGLALTMLPASAAPTRGQAAATSAASAARHTPPGSRPMPFAGVPASVRAAKSRIRMASSAGSPFTLTLTASSPSDPNGLANVPGDTVTLTATTNIDVGPTPYYIEIYSSYGTNLLGACGYGTTCSVPVSYSQPVAPGSVAYVAYVASFSQWLTPPNVQDYTDGNLEPSWLYHFYLAGGLESYSPGNGWLQADPGTYIVAPWYVEIYDLNTGQLVAACAWHSSDNCQVMEPPAWLATYPSAGCSTCAKATVYASQTRTYCVVVARYSQSFPPADIRARGGTVTI